MYGATNNATGDQHAPPLPACGERSAAKRPGEGGFPIAQSTESAPLHASGERGRTLTGRAVFIWLLAFFGVVFSANVMMMKFAIQTMSGTEVDSAYRAGMTFNAEAQAARRQDERAWQVNGHAARNADGGAVVRVEAHDRTGVPLTGLTFSAALERPTDKRADRRMTLAELQTGLYGGKTADVAPGQWDLVLEADRAGERLFFSKTRVFLK